MAFDLQPTLRGELLELRPLRADDYDALFAGASAALIWEQHPARDRNKTEGFRTCGEEGMATGGTLIATDANDGRVISTGREVGTYPRTG